MFRPSSVVKGLRYEDFMDADGNTDRRVVPDDNARHIWARFYDIETNAPIFTGRDSVIRDNHAEIEQERRVGYRYCTYRPDELDLF